MMKKITLAALVVALAVAAAPCSAQTIIAETSFEEPAVYPAVQYVDTGNPAVDHALVNNSGQPPVNYVSTGGEMGFSSYYYNTRNDVGLTDGDWVGVTDFLGDVTAYVDGANGFEISDADGMMTTTFDTVDLTGYVNCELSMWYFLVDTTWETDPPDYVRIWVTVDGGTEIDILNTIGQDIDDLGIEGFWLSGVVDLTGYSTVTLAIENDSNSAYETLYVDRIRITGTTVPVELQSFSVE
jgi:hypothetical protein